jgi:hypothetical protein
MQANCGLASAFADLQSPLATGSTATSQTGFQIPPAPFT